jgi:PIN domain nuclease of toxin-antitoxin system
MICLDSHVLLWWALDPEKLSKRATELCRRMEREGGYVSSISIWELGLKIKKGDLEIGMTIEEFDGSVRKTGVVGFVAVTNELWLANLALDWDHRDPADRTIVATARHLGVPLLSKDRIMHRFGGANAVW